MELPAQNPAPAAPAPPATAPVPPQGAPRPPASAEPPPPPPMAVNHSDFAKRAVEKLGLTGKSWADTGKVIEDRKNQFRPRDPNTGQFLPQGLIPGTPPTQDAPPAPTPATAAAATQAPSTYKIGDKELTQDKILAALKAEEERASWESMFAGEAQKISQKMSEIENLRSQAARDAEKARVEAMIEKQRAQALQQLAMRDPERFQQLMQVGRQEEGDQFFNGFGGQEPDVSGFQRPTPPLNPDDKPLTVGEWKKMQARAAEEARDSRFFNTLSNDIVSSINSDPAIGKLSYPIQVFVAAQVEQDRLNGKIRTDMPLEQARLVAKKYVNEAKSLFQQWHGEQTIKQGQAAAVVAAQIPPSSLSGTTGLPAPSKMTSADRSKESHSDFAKRLGAYARSIAASGGGTY